MIPILEIPKGLSRLLKAAQASDLKRWVSGVDANLRALVERIERENQALLQWSKAVCREALTPYTVVGPVTGTYHARVGEFVLIDTDAGNITVVIPEATPENAGRSLILANQGASTGATAVPAAGTLSWSSSASIYAHTARLLVSDGQGNWSSH